MDLRDDGSSSEKTSDRCYTLLRVETKSMHHKVSCAPTRAYADGVFSTAGEDVIQPCAVMNFSHAPNMFTQI